MRLATPRDDMLFSLRLRPDVVPLSKAPAASIDVAREGIGESSGLLRGVGCERSGKSGRSGEGATCSSAFVARVAMALHTR